MRLPIVKVDIDATVADKTTKSRSSPSSSSSSSSSSSKRRLEKRNVARDDDDGDRNGDVWFDDFDVLESPDEDEFERKARSEKNHRWRQNLDAPIYNLFNQL